jgi:hypothetical protein
LARVARDPAGGRPSVRPISVRNASLSGSTSSGRSRNAGRRIAITFSRQYRSSRNCPWAIAFCRFPIRGGDDAGIGPQHARPAKPLILALLEHAQQLGLRPQAHLRHFVKEQRASRRLLQLPRLALGGVGVGPALVAEKLCFEQLFGQRGAVQAMNGPA